MHPAGVVHLPCRSQRAISTRRSGSGSAVEAQILNIISGLGNGHHPSRVDPVWIARTSTPHPVLTPGGVLARSQFSRDHGDAANDDTSREKTRVRHARRRVRRRRRCAVHRRRPVADDPGCSVLIKFWRDGAARTLHCGIMCRLFRSGSSCCRRRVSC